jgi:hypothetical protein
MKGHARAHAGEKVQHAANMTSSFPEGTRKILLLQLEKLEID